LRVLENRALWRIFGPKREEVAGGGKILHNEELHNLYASPNIIRVTKSRSMRWMGHVARIGEMRNGYMFWAQYLNGRDHSEDLAVDGRIIL
jgi:hypothetical protein